MSPWNLRRAELTAVICTEHCRLGWSVGEEFPGRSLVGCVSAAVSSFLNALSLPFLALEFITSVAAVLFSPLGFSLLSSGAYKGMPDSPSCSAHQLNIDGFGAGAETELYPLC